MNDPCTKVWYPTRQAAQDALLSTRVQASLHLGRHHQKRHEARVYRCHVPDCRGFHLTSKEWRDHREVAS